MVLGAKNPEIWVPLNASPSSNAFDVDQSCRQTHSAGLFNCWSLLTSPDPGRRSSSTKTTSSQGGGKHNLPEPKRNSCTELLWMAVRMLHEEQIIHAEIKFYLRLLYLILQKNSVKATCSFGATIIRCAPFRYNTKKHWKQTAYDTIRAFKHFRHGSGQIGRKILRSNTPYQLYFDYMKNKSH